MANRLAVSAVLIFVAMVCAYHAGVWSVQRSTLKPRESVVVAESGLRFEARLDTGAVVSSINAVDIEVVGGGARPSRDDVGRMIRYVLVNRDGERRQLESRIEQVRGIRTADCREVRYHVFLTVEFAGQSHRVLMNLNDRGRSQDKLLLGRNWLRHGYAVRPVTESEI